MNKYTCVLLLCVSFLLFFNFVPFLASYHEEFSIFITTYTIFIALFRCLVFHCLNVLQFI